MKPEHDEALVEQVCEVANEITFWNGKAFSEIIKCNDLEKVIRTILPVIRTTDAARIAELEAALQKLADLPIEESDGPDTIHLDGKSYQGPVVDWTFKVIRKVKEIARATLKEHQHGR